MKEKPIHVVLNSIVKNEERTISRLLDSVRPVVSDVFIVDTGSEDGTRDILRSKGLRVYESNFIDFGTTRSTALRMCCKDQAPDTYVLLLDADMVLVVENEAEFWSLLQNHKPDVVHIYQRLGNVEYENVRMLRVGTGSAQYVGVTHEYLSTPESSTSFKFSPSVVWIDDKGDGGCRADKFQRDRRLLESAEKTPRTTFYLAQTYRDLGEYDLSISTYQQRIQQGGWFEEVVYSRYQLLCLYLYQKNDLAKAVEQADAIRVLPYGHRPEPFYHLCDYFRVHNNIPESVKYLTLAQMSLPGAENKPLFYETNVARFLVPFEEFMLWYHIHPHYRTEVERLALRLMQDKDIPSHIKDCVRSNYNTFYHQT